MFFALLGFLTIDLLLIKLLRIILRSKRVLHLTLLKFRLSELQCVLSYYVFITII